MSTTLLPGELRYRVRRLPRQLRQYLVGGRAFRRRRRPGGAVEPITTVRINMTNSHRILVAEVPVKDGKAMVDGDFAIDGVRGSILNAD